jgi:hypothetical protein
MGNLTEEEIRELGDFEFETGARRYYLKLKSEKPKKAEQMLADLPEIDDSTLTEEQVMDLCHILYRYWSGFILTFKNQSYTKSTQPIPDSAIRYV